MQIMVKCPQCSSNWILDRSSADKRVKCRRCGRLFKVPKLEEVPKAMRVIKQAKGPIYADKEGKTYG